jgi:hypothetical protein
VTRRLDIGVDVVDTRDRPDTCIREGLVMSIALVVKGLMLLVPALTCLARPDTVQDLALAASRKWGLDDSWREAMLADEFVWVIRACGLMLVLMAAMLVFAV